MENELWKKISVTFPRMYCCTVCWINEKKAQWNVSYTVFFASMWWMYACMYVHCVSMFMYSNDCECIVTNPSIYRTTQHSTHPKIAHTTETESHGLASMCIHKHKYTHTFTHFLSLSVSVSVFLSLSSLWIWYIISNKNRVRMCWLGCMCFVCVFVCVCVLTRER